MPTDGPSATSFKVQPFHSIWPWIGLALGVGFSTLAWALFRHGENQRIQDLQQAHARTMVLQLEDRMKAMEQVLRGAAGYLGRGAVPDRSEWRSYVGTLDLPTTYPGIQGFGFAEWIPTTELAAHVRRLRAEGFPDYAVLPGGPLLPEPEGCSAIIYLEPMDARNQKAFGRDMFAEAVRREAMVRARDTGLITLSGPVTLFQESEADIQSGTLLYAPVYRQGAPLGTVAQRRSAFRGWAYFPFRMTDLVSATLTRSLELADFELFDGRVLLPTRLIFDSDPTTSRVEGRPVLETIEVAGRTWTVRVFPNARFLQSVGHESHWELLAGGLVLSLLLFSLLTTLHAAEGRARKLAQQRGDELLATESRFRALFEKSPMGMAIVEVASGRFLLANPRLGQILGYRPEELQKRTFQEVTHPDHLASDLSAVRDLAQGKVSEFQREKRYLHKSGHEVWARLHVVSLPGEPDGAGRNLALVEDITEAKRSADALRESEARFKAIFDLSPDATTISRVSDGAMLMVNRAWCDLTGYTVEEAIGRTTKELGTWARPEEREALLSDLLRDRAVAPRESVLKRRDGTERQILITANILTLDQEEAVLVQGKDVTELHQTEVSLRKAEARFRSLFNLLPVGATLTNASGHIIQTNPVSERLLGIPSDDMERRGLKGPYWDIIRSDGSQMAPEEYAGVRALHEQRRIENVEMGVRRPDGHVTWLLVTAEPVKTPDEGVLIVYLDISARRRAEAEVRESHDRLKLITETMRDYILILDLEGCITWISKVPVGVPPSNALGAPFTAGLEPEHHALAMTAFHDCISSGCMTMYSAPGMRLDGQPGWFEVRLEPLKVKDRVDAVLVLAFDRTESRRAEAALEESERRFRHLVENAADAIYLHDEEGRILLCNQEACRVTGYTMEELLQMRVEELDQAYEAGRDRVTWLRMRPGEQARFEGRHRRKDGSTFPVEVHVGLLNPDQPRKLLAIARDLLERNRAQESELRARKAESLVLMAGGIAHDFNNLFQAIQGNLEVAAMRAEGNPSLNLSLAAAMGALRRAVGLSWKMLDFSGRGFLLQERLDPGPWLEALVPTLRQEVPATFQIDLVCEEASPISGDRVKLEQVVRAVLENALDASQEGKGCLRFRLYMDFGGNHTTDGPGIWPLKRPDGPATVCLELADQGPGIPSQFLPLVCDPFYSTKAQGRGLGLAAAVGILSAHRAGFHLLNGAEGGLVLRLHFPPYGG